MMLPKKEKAQGADLARVGIENTDLPGTPEEGKPGVPSGDPKEPWRSSAQEELGNFKGVPVVGALPWKTQYLVLAGVLAFSLILLVGSALSGRGGASAGQPAAVSQTRVAVQQAQMQVGVLAKGQVPDARALAQARQEGAASARAAGVDGPWQEVEATLAALDPFVASATRVMESSASARQILAQGRDRAAQQLEQARADGSGQTDEAVLLARLLGHYEVLADLLAPGSAVEGGAERIDATLAAIAQGFQTFRNSPLASQDLAVSRGWRELSSAWASASPLVATLQEASGQGAARDKAVASAQNALMAANRSLDSSGNGSSGGSSLIAWLAAILALISFALLIAVVRKQQQWQVLNAQASNEEADQAILELMEDLEAFGAGDFNRRARVSSSAIGTLADSVNASFDKVRALMKDVRRSNSEVSEAALQANEAAGAVIASQKDRIAVIEPRSQDVLRLLENVSASSHETLLAKAISEQLQTVVMSGLGAVGQASDKIRYTKDRTEESVSRASRVVASSREISHTAELQKEIGEQLHILGMQAAIQAAKAGEAGQGFQVVAKGIQELAEAAGARAKDVSLLVETSLSDLEALESSMGGAATLLDESGRLIDFSHDSWTAMSDRLKELAERFAIVADISEKQEGLTSSLDKETRQDLARTNQFTRETQEASEAISKMVVLTQKMDQMVSKLKA